MIKVTDEMRQVRRDLQSYKYYVDTYNRVASQLDAVLYRLSGVRSPVLDNPTVDSVSLGGKSDNYYRDIELEAVYTTELHKLGEKIADIESMLEGLTRAERALIEEIFFHKVTYADYADNNDYTISGVAYKVNVILKRMVERKER